MAWSKVLTFTDPYPYTSAVLTADMQIFPTAKGEFRAELTQVVLNQLRMQRFEENLPRVHKGAISRDRKVFTFLTADQPEVSNRGRVFRLGELCADDFEVQHVKTGGNYRFGGASLIPEDFAASCKAIVGCELDPERSSQFIRPNPKFIERFLKLHEMVGGIAKAAPELFELPEVVRALEQQLIHALVRCVTEGIVSPMSSGSLRHKVIVAGSKPQGSEPAHSGVSDRRVRRDRHIRANSPSWLRRAPWDGAYPLPHLAKNAPVVRKALAQGPLIPQQQ